MYGSFGPPFTVNTKNEMGLGIHRDTHTLFYIQLTGPLWSVSQTNQWIHQMWLVGSSQQHPHGTEGDLHDVGSIVIHTEVSSTSIKH